MAKFFAHGPQFSVSIVAFVTAIFMVLNTFPVFADSVVESCKLSTDIRTADGRKIRIFFYARLLKQGSKDVGRDCQEAFNLSSHWRVGYWTSGTGCVMVPAPGEEQARAHFKKLCTNGLDE